MKILILCLPGIGDALMATPMINVLHQTMPKSEIHVATMFDSVSYIFKNNPNIEKTIYLPLYKQNKIFGLKSLFLLRKSSYDVSILCFPSFRKEYHLVQWVIGAKKRIAHAFSKGYWSELNILDTNLVSINEKEHNVINNLNLLIPLGIRWEEKMNKTSLVYQFSPDKEDLQFGLNYIKTKGWEKDDIIAIHPGSIDSKAGILKRWSPTRFAKVILYLLKKNKKVFVFTGPFEKEIGKAIYDLVGNKKNCILMDNMSFKQVVGILANTSLLISNDNGFAHIANALRIPSIVLFGPTNNLWCGPYNSAITTVIRKATFIPWFRNDMKVTHPPINAPSGMEKIDASDVIQEVEKIWKK